MGDRPGHELAELTIADPPERWEALGFTAQTGVCELGGITLRLGASGRGITSWSIRGVTDAIDGLATTTAPPPPQLTNTPHPNGARGIDHIVIVTPDFDRTVRAFEVLGLGPRRIREVPSGDFRQGFRRIGPAILELVEAKRAPPGPARFWGLVVIVDDLDALAERLGDQLSERREAVQPGRRIATLRASAGLGEAVAFMTPAG